MNFDFGSEEKSLQQKIRSLFDDDSKASLDRMKSENDAEAQGAMRDWFAALGRAGYLSLVVENVKNSVALTAAGEALAESAPSLFLSAGASAGVFGRLIASRAEPGLKDEILTPLKEGRIVGAVALSEGGMSLEGAPFETTAVSDGNVFLVSGSKHHVVNAPFSDWLAIAGKAEGGTAFFLLKTDSEGLEVQPRLATLSYEGTAVSGLTLKNCRAACERVLGPFEDHSVLLAVRAWEDEILTIAGLGAMKRSYEAALRYAKTHGSGGKPIIAHQEIGFKLAEMLTMYQTSRLLAYRAAWMAETGEKEADLLRHCAKVFCAESAEKVASQALQILGGAGCVRENPAEEGYRDAKYLQIAATSSEISRMKIGDGVLAQATGPGA